MGARSLVLIAAAVAGAAGGCDTAAMPVRAGNDGGAPDAAVDGRIVVDVGALEIPERDGPRGVVMTFDRAGCAERPLATCDNISPAYTSNDLVAIPMTDALAACAPFLSFDGCEALVYSFADDGCLDTVEIRVGGADHLQNLRTCFSLVLEASRWSCLASGTIRFDESCFIN